MFLPRSCLTFLCLLLACVAGAVQNQPATKAPSPAEEVFGLTKVHEFHLSLTAKEWETMQPPGSMTIFGWNNPKKTAAKPDEKPADVHKGGSFGIEFPWAKADFIAEGKTYKEVGLRYKGGGSYIGSVNKLKRNLKIELDRYSEAQRFHGLKTLTLNSESADPSKYREALAYAVYRAAGVPAPRTTFAQVTLSVTGKYDKEFVGLYTFVEHVDKPFLKTHFKNGKGLLLKPERPPGTPWKSPLGYLGEDWEPYKKFLGPKREPTKEEAKRVLDFIKLIHQPDLAKFHKEIGNYLDIENFLRFVGCTALVANLDSMFTVGHNCLIYLNPETNKFAFMPWDLDLAFGGFFLFGTPDQQADLSLTHPYAGNNKLIERLLASKEVSDQYQKLLKEIASTSFTKEVLLKNLVAIETATKDVFTKEAKAIVARKENKVGFGFGPVPKLFDLRPFLEKRTISVAAQLAGTTKGYTPKTGFPFGVIGDPPEKVPPKIEEKK